MSHQPKMIYDGMHDQRFESGKNMSGKITFEI